MTRAKFHNPGQTYFLEHSTTAFGHCLFDDACCKFYLARMFNSLQQFHVALHAYCILPDRVCLLLTPRTPKGAFNLLRSVGHQYNVYYRDRFDRQGVVFTERVTSVALQSSQAVLESQKHIERLPLGHALVAHPGIYRWSSYCANAFGAGSPALIRHRAYSEFILRSSTSHAAYRDFIACSHHSRQHQDLLQVLSQSRRLCA